MKMRQFLKYIKTMGYRVHTISKKEFSQIKEGEPISMELALRVLQGDPEAIKELGGEK